MINGATRSPGTSWSIELNRSAAFSDTFFKGGPTLRFAMFAIYLLTEKRRTPRMIPRQRGNSIVSKKPESKPVNRTRLVVAAEPIPDNPDDEDYEFNPAD